jgi:hypothetical protein
MPGWGAYVSETEYQNHIASHVDQSEVSELFSRNPGNLINSINFLTDQYMRVTTRRLGPSQYSVISRVRSIWGCIGHMFKTLHDTQKWRWRPTKRREVSFTPISCVIFFLNLSPFRYCNVDFVIFAALAGELSFGLSSRTTLPVNGQKTSGNV